MTKMKKIDVPYPMPPCLSEDKREEFMAWNTKLGFPRLKHYKQHGYTMQIICYGPSLKDTWQDIDPNGYVMTMSGSLTFLLEKGLKPVLGKWFHIHVDPRAHKMEAFDPPHPDVIYLMASVSNPKMFWRLKGFRCVLWHAVSGPHTHEWVRQNDPGNILVAAGSTVGLCSVHMGGILGFYHFEIFGMDGSFKDGQRHAGPHKGMEQGQRPSIINPDYQTSRLMENANVETQQMLKSYPIFCVFHGDGIMQDWVKKAGLINAANHGTQDAERVRTGRYLPIDMETAKKLYAQGMPILQEKAA